MIDLAAVSAIDVHVHTELSRDGHDPMPAPLREAAARYFGSHEPLPTVDDVAAYYRERNIAAVVFTVDWESRSGFAPIPNEEIAEAAAANADVLIPFASVDPARPDAVARAKSLISEHAVKGFKFHPNLQAFFPDATYNSTVPWPFASLAEQWGGRGLEARTPRQLRDALTTAWRTDCFTLIDVALERGDLSPILRGFVQAFKKQVSVS